MEHVGEMREFSLETATTFRGGCHCGAVSYEVVLDGGPAGGSSVWESRVRAGGFRLLSGEAELSGHAFAGAGSHHFFCECCGVRSFSRHGGGTADAGYYSVDLKCLSAVVRVECA
jgi:hypothetical protein